MKVSNRTKQVAIRFTAEEYKSVVLAARHDGKRVSDYIRSLAVHDALNRWYPKEGFEPVSE